MLFRSKELASIVDISAGLQDSVTSDQSPFVPEVILPSVEVHLARSLSPKEPLINGNIVEEPVGLPLQTKIELTGEPKDLLLDQLLFVQLISLMHVPLACMTESRRLSRVPCFKSHLSDPTRR